MEREEVRVGSPPLTGSPAMPNADDILPRLIGAANKSAPLSDAEAKALLLEAVDVIRTLRILVGIREEVEAEDGR
jgi:hypothetical protein